jgi:hypothetical protein
MAAVLNDPRKVPTLSEDAWVSDARQKVDYLLAHFFLSDYSQTQLYLSHVSSMPWIIQSTQGDMLQTVLKVRDTLQVYLGRYLDDVVVDVADTTPTDQSAAEIVIYVSFKDSETGLTHTLNEVLRERNGVFNRVSNINNDGL